MVQIIVNIKWFLKTWKDYVRTRASGNKPSCNFESKNKKASVIINFSIA